MEKLSQSKTLKRFLSVTLMEALLPSSYLSFHYRGFFTPTNMGDCCISLRSTELTEVLKSLTLVNYWGSSKTWQKTE